MIRLPTAEQERIPGGGEVVILVMGEAPAQAGLGRAGVGQVGDGNPPVS